MNKVPMTREGFEKLHKELRLLRTIERPAVIQAITDARELGDLSENAEYQYAREKQSFLEGRIAEIEAKLSRADVIEVERFSGDEIKFGASVCLSDLEKNEEISYKIVGVDEADLSVGQISFTSPLARVLIGKCVGDVVEVQTPGGEKSYRVISVLYKR